VPAQKVLSHPLLAGSSFGAKELEEARWLIDRALAEDLPEGDLTTDALFAADGPGGGPLEVRAAFTPRAPGILCGLPVVREIFERAAPGEVRLVDLVGEGSRLEARRPCLEVIGPPAPVLRLERTALNFLGRLCGIATLTRRYADEIEGLPVLLLDTRKTTPGWRRLEKYAVRVGGGQNHRGSLSDGILLKDNHAGVLRAAGRGGFRHWVAALRQASPGVFLEVEVDGREELQLALEADVDAILLDNLSTADLRWAVEQKDAASRGKTPLLEASGGLRLDRLREVAATGVDRISVGALTHSAPALDIGLDLVSCRRAPFA